jgi:hypothetical protein
VAIVQSLGNHRELSPRLPLRDPTVALDLDARSSGGGVSCDLPVTARGKMRRDSLEGKLNGGGAVLELSSSGGGESIEGR